MPLRPRSRLPAFRWHRFYSCSTRFAPVNTYTPENSHNGTLDTSTPIILRNRFGDMPAISKWFKLSGDGSRELNAPCLEPYGSTLVPLELTRSDPNSNPENSSFERFQAPLSLLISYMTETQEPSMRLYLAQCPLEDLPEQLQSDLPKPDLISKIGKGDIYGSSLWAGRPPTRTPLHRDPNPNLFVQLAGTKVVRLMKPDAGRKLYMSVRSSGHAHMRGEEMMVGDENARLEEAVWGDDGSENRGVHGWEAVLESGDGLYIPLGWWHSVRGVGSGVNASVNWWFR